ncbi:MAG: transcription antitermination factor NusB [Christensenellales bacterium]
MSRVLSREVAFKLIFEYCITGEKNDFSVEQVLSENESADAEYVKRIYNGVTEKFTELESELASKVNGFTIDRIFKIDLSLLVLALYEIKYMDSIPPVVSINEVINLAKQYSTEKSASYINGVLSNFVGK